MGFCSIRTSRRIAILTVLAATSAACSSGVPTSPSALSTLDSGSAASAGSAAVAATAAGGAKVAAADTIKITQGLLALDSNRPGTATLRGSRGFRFEGRTLSGVDPSTNCSTFDPCAPGEIVPFTATWAGADLPGTATLQGKDYADVGGFNSDSSLRVDLTGSFVAPAEAAAATVTVPFTVNGTFLGGGLAELQGTGRVTFTLVWQSVGGWAISSSSFDFGH